MIGKLNHVAIVVPDLAAAAETYARTLGATVSEPVDMPEHGVTTVFVELPNTKIELLQPLGEDSPVRRHLERNPLDDLDAIAADAGSLARIVRQYPDLRDAEIREDAARHASYVDLRDFDNVGAEVFQSFLEYLRQHRARFSAVKTSSACSATSIVSSLPKTRRTKS